MAFPSRSEDRPSGRRVVVREQRPRLRGESSRDRRPLHGSARERDRARHERLKACFADRSSAFLCIYAGAPVMHSRWGTR
jgi:hypothetical protein